MFDPIYKSFETLLDYPKKIDQPSNPTKKILALIPVFRDPYVHKKNLPAFIKSAAYSRASCLKNTDAISMGVEVKLYVQETTFSEFIESFELNHIDFEKDIRTFPVRLLGYGEGKWGHLSKKLRSYYHFSLQEYDRIVCWDSDIWFINHQTLFQQLMKLPIDSIAYPRTYERKLSSIMNRMRGHTSANGIAIEELSKMAGLNNMPRTIVKPVGYFWTHPARSLFTDMTNFDFIRWIADYTPYLSSDEEGIAFASHKFGYPIQTLEKNITFKKIRDVISEESNAHIAHGRMYGEQIPIFNSFLQSL